MTNVHSRGDVHLTLMPRSSATPIVVPDLWAHTELVLRLRGDRRPLAGHRTESYLVRGGDEAMLDELQRQVPWDAHRVDRGTVLFVGDDLLVEVSAQPRAANACQVSVEVRAATPEDADRALEQLRPALHERRTEQPEQFVVRWAFRTAQNDLMFARVEEAVASHLADAAYPTLRQGVQAFVEAFLDSSECVLVLQGPPGTGKTQLIRGIAAAMSRRKGRSAEVMYSNDERVLTSDEFFVRFATGNGDAMVLEDADHNLMARSRGNTELHRMLNVSDGLIRAQGRKMIFSTNLPNLHDLDDALVRPGRCYACLKLRGLSAEEVRTLLIATCADSAQVQLAREMLGEERAGGFTLAEAYRAVRLATRPAAEEVSQARAS